ncbi:DKNYY domain-containing protein [uncultured Aquimarina sp.]|uniref:DKNYY domain-containing protein n=1 Tax=uncultured Aquimarina sp. TaxID=575652 RepID=UPI002638D00D|nr:DKNYY domain-containing protein [uncultured Aquimarina sp.]
MVKKVIMIIAVVFVTIGALCIYGVYRFFNPFGKEVNKELSDSYYYTRDNEGIIYSPMGNWFELGKDEMQVDMASFQVLGRDYAKDKNHAYFKSKAINNDIDLASFRVQLGYTPMDKDHVYILNDNYYHIGQEDKKALKILEGADANTFTQISFDFAKDKNFVYQNYTKKDSLDVASFQEINSHFCKDYNGVYYYSYGDPLRKIEEANINEIVSLTNYYIRDNRNVYFYVGYKDTGRFDQVVSIPFKDPESIAFFEDVELIKIDTNVYYRGDVIENADVTTFEEVKHGYTKDKNYVFFLGKIMEGADAKTFKYNSRTYTFSDKNHTYEMGKILKK